MPANLEINTEAMKTKYVYIRMAVYAIDSQDVIRDTNNNDIVVCFIELPLIEMLTSA